MPLACVNEACRRALSHDLSFTHSKMLVLVLGGDVWFGAETRGSEAEGLKQPTTNNLLLLSFSFLADQSLPRFDDLQPTHVVLLYAISTLLVPR